MKKILFQDTSFRDGFQSFFGARVLTEDFIPAVEAAVHAGINHFEAGGGARFQSLFLYCGESAFDMMDKFRKAAGPDANLQTLARGINVVALSQQPKDMIDLHAKTFKKHGITHIRNFDALNDVRNLEYSGERIKDAGLHHQAVVTMMELPPGCTGAHDAAFYLKTLRQILDSGLPLDSICFKDASGTSHPKKFYETVKGARELVGNDVILWVHSHETAAQGVDQYMAAIEAGCDGICIARAPVSGGTSQPDIISMWNALKGTEYTLDIDISKVLEANSVFKECMKDYYFPPEALRVSSEVILSPMPGGALTANTMMMRDTGTLHLYPKVIEAMSECVAKGGYGTSVTPVSQFYFQQAYANVTQGPWKKITDGYGNMVLGYFGRTPVEPDPEVVKVAEEQMGKPRFEGNPVDVLDPGIPKAKEILEKEGLPVNDENIFIVGALATPGGNKGLEFLKGNFSISVRKVSQEKEKEAKAPEPVKSAKDGGGFENFVITVDGKDYNVTVREGDSEIQTVSQVSKAPAQQQKVEQQQTSSNNVVPVTANLPGNVYKVAVNPGDDVKENDTLIVLEAMKMETPVASPCAGKIHSVEVNLGEVVESGQLLLTINQV
ncbi:biotin attachment protein [Desulfobacterota bacterium AH_259_B03_O07]|nr:biotin attachment protein [Desulfobacterota bacterium AH_259_B03_O07]